MWIYLDGNVSRLEYEFCWRKHILTKDRSQTQHKYSVLHPASNKAVYSTSIIDNATAVRLRKVQDIT